jgi:lysozyme inhibitor LprI
MSRNYLADMLTAATLVIGFATCAAAEEKAEVLYASPNGAIRIERDGEDAWLIYTKDPTQRAKMPPLEGTSPVDDEYHSSPNDEWIFGLRHGGSCLRDGDLFHRLVPDKIDMFESFNQAAWKNAVKLGVFKRDFSAEGFCAMTEFVSWSFDSARLLIELRGGEDKREKHEGYVYFNLLTKNFEVTNYLRKLNKTKAKVLAAAEPIDPLPKEAELKTRLDGLDQQLNKKYADVLAQAGEGVPLVREAQRNWIKHRDEGAKVYVSLFPATEKERRRLQFLGDVTAARIEVGPDEWSYD